MAFLTGITDERPTRERLAKAVKRSERSVKRAIAELVEKRWITCPGGGHGTASKIIVLNAVDWILARDSQMARDPEILARDWSKMARDWSRIRVLEVSPRTRINQQESFPQGEKQNLSEHIKACGFEPTPSILQKLAHKAQYYGVTGYVLSAHIRRAWLRTVPSNRPRSEGWILVVVENALASTEHKTGTNGAAPGAVVWEERGSYHEYPGIDIGALAAQKRMVRNG